MSAPAPLPYTPHVMTPAVFNALRAEGFNLPDDATYPFPARVAPDLTSRDGWRVLNSEDGVVYVAPDGSQFTRATHGARPVLVGVSRRTSPLPLRVRPGTRRPKWVIADTPKGEIPEHLKRFLLKPGQKLAKGEQRKAEEIAVEPVTSRGARAGSAVAALGPRPKAGTPARTEWNRAYRALRKDHFKAYRETRRSSSARATARA